jgi:hypothetical protein
VENDGVLDKVLATIQRELKKEGNWSIKIDFNNGAGESELEQALEHNWAERTKHGWIFLPDHPCGGKWGSLFFALLTKIAGQ